MAHSIIKYNFGYINYAYLPSYRDPKSEWHPLGDYGSHRSCLVARLSSRFPSCPIISHGDMTCLRQPGRVPAPHHRWSQTQLGTEPNYPSKRCCRLPRMCVFTGEQSGSRTTTINPLLMDAQVTSVPWRSSPALAPEASLEVEEYLTPP